MTRRLLVAVAMSLAAGCTHSWEQPLFPSAPPPGVRALAAARAAVAGRLHGCTVSETMPPGLQAQCGAVVANVWQSWPSAIGLLLERGQVRQEVADRRDRTPTRSTRSLVLDGKAQTVTVLAFPAGPTAERPAVTEMTAYLRPTPGHLLGLFCRSPGATVSASCPTMLSALARPPWPPAPGIMTASPQPLRRLRGRFELALTIHTRSGPPAGPPWPPATALLDQPQCTIRRANASQVAMDCGHSFATLLRLPGAGVSRGATLDAIRRDLVGLAPRLARSQLGLDGTPRTLPCKVGGEATTCARVRVTNGHTTADLTFGAGRVLGAPALVECIDELPGRPDPPGCARYLEAAPGPPPPQPPVPDLAWIPGPLRRPPPTCVHTFNPGEHSLLLVCGHRLTSVYTAPSDEADMGTAAKTDDLYSSVETGLEELTEDGSHLDGVDWLECTIGRGQHPCARVRYRDEAGPEVTLYVDIVHGSTNTALSCTWPGTAARPPGLCGRIVTLGKPIPVPPKPRWWKPQ